MAYIVMAYIVMAYMVLACVVMTYVLMALHSYGLSGGWGMGLVHIQLWLI